MTIAKPQFDARKNAQYRYELGDSLCDMEAGLMSFQQCIDHLRYMPVIYRPSPEVALSLAAFVLSREFHKQTDLVPISQVLTSFALEMRAMKKALTAHESRSKDSQRKGWATRRKHQAETREAVRAALIQAAIEQSATQMPS